MNVAYVRSVDVEQLQEDLDLRVESRGLFNGPYVVGEGSVEVLLYLGCHLRRDERFLGLLLFHFFFLTAFFLLVDLGVLRA